MPRSGWSKLLNTTSTDTTAQRAAAIVQVVTKTSRGQFSQGQTGRWHDQPVGPHLQAMYQIKFEPNRLSAILSWFRAKLEVGSYL
jgi:aromatic ring-cleaving dioxygenase